MKHISTTFDYTAEEWAAMTGHQKLDAMRFAKANLDSNEFGKWLTGKTFGNAHTNIIANNFAVRVNPVDIEAMKRKLEYMGSIPIDDLDDANCVLNEHGKQLKRREAIKQRAKIFVDGIIFDFRMKQNYLRQFKVLFVLVSLLVGVLNCPAPIWIGDVPHQLTSAGYVQSPTQTNVYSITIGTNTTWFTNSQATYHHLHDTNSYSMTIGTNSVWHHSTH